MSIYKINFESIRQKPEILEMLAALERGFFQFGIDYYLIGAVARDIWMNGVNNIAPRRTTGDIDFAVLINDKGIYEKLKDYLIRNESFQPTHENAFVLIWKDKTEVDLMPFGAIADEDGRVSVSGTGYTSIEVPGLKEVYEASLPEIELNGQCIFKCSTLPSIVMLKFIAWNDRPEIRRDDIKDISDILSHYFDMNDEEIWEYHSDLFAMDDANLLHISARVIGRKMKVIASKNQKLYKRILELLEENTKDAKNSRMAAIMVEYFDNTLLDNVLVLQHLKQGFIDNNLIL